MALLTFLGLIHVEVAILYDFQRFAHLNCSHADNRLHARQHHFPTLSDHHTHLNAEQEEIQIEARSREHEFIRHSHHNRGAAVCENGNDRISCWNGCSWLLDAGRPWGRWQRGSYRRVVSSAFLVQVNDQVIALLVVCHGFSPAVGPQERWMLEKGCWKKDLQT